ncbi:MAG: hypothetical protein PVJ15_03230 [Gammaproteobacteria bacterium]|jgi:hypothetical protein
MAFLISMQGYIVTDNPVVAGCGGTARLLTVLSASAVSRKITGIPEYRMLAGFTVACLNGHLDSPKY